MRFLVVRCDAWPLVAAGCSDEEPAVTVRQNRVVAANAAARAEGVQPGVRRRESQARCPALVVLDEDPANEARLWEPMVAVLEDITPRIEIPAPGVVAFPTRGPSRYFGGDEALAQRVLETLQLKTPQGRRRLNLQVGVADGFFAASLASRVRPTTGSTVMIEPGQSPGWLAPYPVDTLDDVDLAAVLSRLGLKTLGAFAQLDPGDVVGRFGQAGSVAHRLASGLDPRPADTTAIPDDLTVSAEIDPPALRVDQVAFLGKALADELHHRLGGNGMACTQVMIEAESEHGESRRRVWRHEGALSAGALSDRVRWQLDGWLNGDAAHRPTAGISLLRLVPDEVVPAVGRQLGFWGDRSVDAEKVTRAVARVQGVLGAHSVKVPERRGGRGLRQEVVAVSAASVDLAGDRSVDQGDLVGAPWPGRLPSPLPARVLDRPQPVRVLDRHGEEVTINGRGEISATPSTLVFDGGDQAVTAWAGPWLVDDRWWDGTRRVRQGRLQVITEDGRAHLVTRTRQRWWFEATYD